MSTLPPLISSVPPAFVVRLAAFTALASMVTPALFSVTAPKRVV